MHRWPRERGGGSGCRCGKRQGRLKDGAQRRRHDRVVRGPGSRNLIARVCAEVCGAADRLLAAAGPPRFRRRGRGCGVGRGCCLRRLRRRRGLLGSGHGKNGKGGGTAGLAPGGLSWTGATLGFNGWGVSTTPWSGAPTGSLGPEQRPSASRPQGGSWDSVDSPRHLPCRVPAPGMPRHGDLAAGPARLRWAAGTGLSAPGHGHGRRGPWKDSWGPATPR